jgi:hypothetical protein
VDFRRCSLLPAIGRCSGMKSFTRSFISPYWEALYLTSVFDSAHRAANPEKYPVLEETKELYSALVGVEGRMKPTMVHLQVYDGTHPADYLVRSVATLTGCRCCPRAAVGVWYYNPSQVLLPCHRNVHQACHEYATDNGVAAA